MLCFSSLSPSFRPSPPLWRRIGGGPRPPLPRSGRRGENMRPLLAAGDLRSAVGLPSSAKLSAASKEQTKREIREQRMLPAVSNAQTR
eukprot:scaffold3058_cov232-Pinguiococcus_pyrenoidosus.AAC.9